MIDPDEEEGIAAILEGTRQRQASVTADPDVAARVPLLAATSRGLPPGAALSLAKAGVQPGDPTSLRTVAPAAKRKAKKGLGWHTFGEVVSEAGRAGGRLIDQPGAILGGAAKATVRGVFTGAEAGVEYVDAVARDVGRSVKDKGVGGLADLVTGTSLVRAAVEQPTTASVALADLVSGRDVDLGSGYFPGGKSKEQQAAFGRKVYSIDGHAGTIGRITADVVTEPGTKPYTILSGLVDLASDLTLDPVAALGATRAARLRADKTFTTQARTGIPKLAERVGLIDARVKTFDPVRARNWLDSPEFGRMADDLASTSDFNSIWRRTRKKLPVAEVLRLVDATDPAAVKKVVEEAVFGGRTGRIPTGTLGYDVKQATSRVRLLQQMPGTHVDFEDLDSAVEQVDRFQRNAKLPESVISANNEAVARASSAPERLAALDPVLDTVAQVLVNEGIDPATANKMTRLFKDSHKAGRLYAVDRLGRNMNVPGVQIDPNTMIPMANPHIYAEYLNSTVPLPNARDIRRATSNIAWAFKIPGMKGSTALLDFASNQVWKPLVLLRGAWTVRVVAEEQVRMGASGLTSAFAHPLSYISWAAHRTPREVPTDAGPIARGIAAAGRGVTAPARTAGLAGRGEVDVMGNLLSEAQEHIDAMSRGSAGFRGPKGTIRLKDMTIWEQGEEGFIPAWADEIARLASDPLVPRVLREPIDEVKTWFWSEQGRLFRERLGAAKPEFLTDRTFADRWIDSLAERAREVAGDDPTILDAIATGQLDGVTIRTTTKGGAPAIDQSVLTSLQILADEGRGPLKVKGWQIFHLRDGKGELARTYDETVERMFNALMSRRTNQLSRSPAFNQFYWQKATELLPLMDDAARAGTIDAARKAKLPEREIAAMAKVKAAAIPDVPSLTLEQADLVSKAHGLDSTRKLLYDLTDRSQFFDVTRLLFPFGEAWKEILTTWGRIGLQQGGVPVRRGQQIVQGARGAGWFYTDPQTGEEVFNYPGTAFLNEKLIGAPIPLQGRVGGLNLMGNSVLPGLGPVVQIPMSKLIPNKPEWDWLHEAVLPFGDPNFEQGVLESQLPAWLQKLRTFNDDPESDRLFANTVTDLMRYMVSTGEYSTATPEEMERLENDAIAKARGLYLIRAGAQFFAPSAPRPQAIVADKDGKTMAAEILMRDFHKMQEDDYDTAVDTFLDKYGENALLLMQPKSRSVVGGLPVTKVGNNWVRAHPDVVKNFPLVYGYFAPKGDPDDFDVEAYTRQIEGGQREALTPKEVQSLANARVGNMLYQQAKAKAGTTAEGQLWLRQVREAIAAKYPGFGETLGLAERAKFPQVLAQLEEAAADPLVADTEAGKGLALYLAAREKALASARALVVNGKPLTGFGKAKAARPIREWLQAVAAALGERHPDFAPLFDQALSREFEADDTEEAAA